METGMIIIAVVLFAIVLVPILLIIQNTKKQANKLTKGLHTIVIENKGSLTHHAEHHNFAIGIDEPYKTLYFYKKLDDLEITKTIDLALMKSCEVLIKSKRIKKEKTSYDLVEKVTLSFSPIKGIQQELVELYNENDNSQLNGELAIAEDWKNIAQGLILPIAIISEDSIRELETVAMH